MPCGKLYGKCKPILLVFLLTCYTSSNFAQKQPCLNNQHRFRGEWLLSDLDSSIQAKSFVCCGGKRDGHFDYLDIPEHYCNWSESITDFFMYGHIGRSSQCRDDCCNCDRSDDTRFISNIREKYYWSPNNCTFQTWDAQLFCRLLGNRTVTLLGDSTTIQAGSTLTSMIAAGGGLCGPQIVRMWGHTYSPLNTDCIKISTSFRHFMKLWS